MQRPNYAVGYATADNAFGTDNTRRRYKSCIAKTWTKGRQCYRHRSLTWYFFSKEEKKCMQSIHGRTKQTGENRVVFMDEYGNIDDGN